MLLFKEEQQKNKNCTYSYNSIYVSIILRIMLVLN